MDDFTETLLKEWGSECGIDDNTINIFKDEEIDKKAFLSLTEDMIKELIPKIGKRAKFVQKLEKFKRTTLEVFQENNVQPLILPPVNTNESDKFKNIQITDIEVFEFEDIPAPDNLYTQDLFQDETLYRPGTSAIIDNGITSEVNEELTCKSSVYTVEESASKDYIKKILNNYSDGNLVIKYYESVGSLNQSMRNTLASVIIKHEIQHNTKIDKIKFLFLSNGIHNLFSNETKETYFTPYYKEGHNITPMRGKLYDKYCNLKKEIKKTNDQSIDIPTNSISDDNSINLKNSDYEDKLLWLKNNVEPIQTLQTFWIETMEYRQKKKENLIELYPGLQRPTGYILIELDFQHLYPNKEFLLLNKIDVFKVQLIKYIDKFNFQFGVQHFNTVRELKNPSKPGNDYLSILKLLPLLFQPITIRLNNKRKKDCMPSVWRPSKVEQAAAFITFIPDVSELKTLHNSKIEKALQFGLTLQPYVVIVGSNEIFTVVNNIYFKLETPLKGLDVCFKTFFSLNIHYPAESEQVWFFIQKYFYDINLKSDKNILSVQTLINDLSNI
uniref:SAM domain-containing protein n=1 Tax=Schizaphis graminum TaxID=13262 RepID=A0A2S2NVE9_SCHGA